MKGPTTITAINRSSLVNKEDNGGLTLQIDSLQLLPKSEYTEGNTAELVKMEKKRSTARGVLDTDRRNDAVRRRLDMYTVGSKAVVVCVALQMRSRPAAQIIVGMRSRPRADLDNIRGLKTWTLVTI